MTRLSSRVIRVESISSSETVVVHLGLEGIDPGLFTTCPVGLVHEGHELDTFLSG